MRATGLPAATWALVRAGGGVDPRAWPCGGREELDEPYPCARGSRGNTGQHPAVGATRQRISGGCDKRADHPVSAVNTVRSHVRALHAKLGVSSRAEAVVAAGRRGLIGPRWSDRPWCSAQFSTSPGEPGGRPGTPRSSSGRPSPPPSTEGPL
jgi:hypothetical protein